MEAQLGGGSSHFYGNGVLERNGIGKRNFEWDLNDWKWDGDLFLASPLNGGLTDRTNKQLITNAANGLPSNSSSSGSEETDLYPTVEANGEDKNGKKSKLAGCSTNRPVCQVEGCGTDLSTSKDYHRRHKVCEMHAKATTAVVGNAVQRFCQQCSRFHHLQEFDEGKRSCRRRLAGHNRRRRKTHPDAAVGGTTSDEKSSSSLLMSLLKILTNLHSDSAEPANNQDLVSHFLRSLANLAGLLDATKLAGLLQSSQSLQKLGNSAGTSSDVANALILNSASAPEASRKLVCSVSAVACVSAAQDPCKLSGASVPCAIPTECTPARADTIRTEPTVHKARLKDFDLNSTYGDTQECGEAYEQSVNPAYIVNGSPTGPSWLLQDSRQLSPPQTSGTSYSTSEKSQSSSNGDGQCRTDRIVFKLFGKDPNDLPLVLRAQILDWLSNSPTDIESYIRPGCIILTVYLRLTNSALEELCNSLSSYLERLLNSSANDFWRSGWIYARIEDQIAFIHNGQILLEAPLPLAYHDHCEIACVSPIAVPHSSKVTFTVKGFNLARSATRILCSFEGKCLVEETTKQSVLEETDEDTQQEGPECLSFSCSLPESRGRGFIEVEDETLSNAFFPFIVADQELCSEICILESSIDVVDDCSEERSDTEIARKQALYFINELGWLLRKTNLRTKYQKMEVYPALFHLRRFQWLISFAMEHDWCAVIKQLLDILFSGTVDLDGKSPREIALSENLLHTAVRRNCKAMVKVLLKYTPPVKNSEDKFEKLLFRPDVVGPSNLTPLHIAAATSGAEGVLDALTDDPDMRGITAWKSARDNNGFTPEDYARVQGHESYLHLVRKKTDRELDKGHVVIGIPGNLCAKFANDPRPVNSSFEISKNKLASSAPAPYCNRCSMQLAHRSLGTRTLLYRPLILSMVGIAAVCVCVGLLFKSPPTVLYVFPSFRWELLTYGSM
uniref:SBP-type domain-containing protein n=1 Tax=Ananas comosus var. bracteatus TaxID=296719 RepID=A0A6V7PG35_ANACO|nr:unnamed protein product [Ananas comosus var. bracteatus]